MFFDIFGGIIVEGFSLIHPFDDLWMYRISSLNSFDKCKQKSDYFTFPHHYQGSIHFVNTTGKFSWYVSGMDYLWENCRRLPRVGIYWVENSAKYPLALEIVWPLEISWSDKDKRTKRQKDKKTKRQRDHQTKQLKDQKESLIVWCQGSFTLLRFFYAKYFLYLQESVLENWSGNLLHQCWFHRTL